MEVQDYLKKMKKIQKKILEFIENDGDIEECFQNLIQLFQDQNISENREEIKAIIRLIVKIANNHRRSPDFFNKIERIIKNFKDDIKKFSNSEIFHLVKSNKRTILYFIKENILIPDESIANIIMPENITFSNMKFIRLLYPLYFFNEFKRKNHQAFTPEEINNISKMNFKVFEEKRLIGENDNHICHLIRSDSIEEFISYVNKTNFSLKSIIESSIFETNSLLLKKDSSLIEYSAFFGSTQIFKYLYLNGVELTSSLWIYAIHGNNPELIHLLEENKIKPKDETYNEILKESIKCHHFDITNYIQNNFLQNRVDNNDYTFSQSIKYANYVYFPSVLDNESIFYDLCRYDYFTLVNILLKTKKIDVNKLIILFKYLNHIP